MKKPLVALVAFGSFFLGAATLFVFFKAQPRLAGLLIGVPAPERGGQFFDPFAEAERLHQSMGFPGLLTMGDEQNIVEREDEEAVYYEITGIDQTKLNTKVENGQLTISGETRKRSGDEDSFFRTEMQSTFQRSFPLPPGVIEEKMEISSEKDKVVLRFPKRS